MSIIRSTGARRLFQGFLVAAAASLLVLEGAPAFAANVTVTQGSDRGSVNRADNFWYEACDREADGNGVYIDVWVYTDGLGHSVHYYRWDGNGSSAGCGNGNLPSTYLYWEQGHLRVCEDDSGTDGTVGGNDSCSKYTGF